jgi:hypothetical protein
MVRPQYPSPDAFHDNYQVEPHLSKTPMLTDYGRNDAEISLKLEIHAELRRICRSKGIKLGTQVGLYYTNSDNWNNLSTAERPSTKILVIEFFNKEDLDRWPEIDVEARQILAKCQERLGHEICIRYYEFWRKPASYKAQQEESERIRRRAQTERDRRRWGPRVDYSWLHPNEAHAQNPSGADLDVLREYNQQMSNHNPIADLPVITDHVLPLSPPPTRALPNLRVSTDFSTPLSPRIGTTRPYSTLEPSFVDAGTPLSPFRSDGTSALDTIRLANWEYNPTGSTTQRRYHPGPNMFWRPDR